MKSLQLLLLLLSLEQDKMAKLAKHLNINHDLGQDFWTYPSYLATLLNDGRMKNSDEIRFTKNFRNYQSQILQIADEFKDTPEIQTFVESLCEFGALCIQIKNHPKMVKVPDEEVVAH